MRSLRAAAGKSLTSAPSFPVAWAGALVALSGVFGIGALGSASSVGMTAALVMTASVASLASLVFAATRIMSSKIDEKALRRTWELLDNRVHQPPSVFECRSFLDLLGPPSKCAKATARLFPMEASPRKILLTVIIDGRRIQAEYDMPHSQDTSSDFYGSRHFGIKWKYIPGAPADNNIVVEAFPLDRNIVIEELEDPGNVVALFPRPRLLHRPADPSSSSGEST
jgi:hypothetical protein